MKRREPVEPNKPQEIVEDSEGYYETNILKIM